MSSHEPWEELGSRLPTDAAYWEALARRIDVTCADVLEASDRSTPWWGGMARFSRSLSVLAAAAILAAMTLFPTRRAAPESPDPGPLARVLEPSDPEIRGLVDGHAPPSLEDMLTRDGGPTP